MSYTTIAKVRANEYILSLAVSAKLTDLVVQDRIDFADEIVEADLSVIADFTAFTTTPIVIAKLSNYKATELCLVWLYTTKRKGDEEDDVRYWQTRYDNLLEKALNGDVSLGDADNGNSAFNNYSKEDVEPALGTGEFAEFQPLSELQEERPTSE